MKTIKFDKAEKFRKKGDYRSALKYYLKSVKDNENTEGKALNNIGVIYQNALIGDYDYDAAIKCYSQAIELGCIGAYENLVRMYVNNRKYKDINKAIEMIANCKFDLSEELVYLAGVAFHIGNGIEKNEKLAFHYLYLARNMGHKDNYYLALMYLYNLDGVHGDVKKGLKILKDNSESGDYDSTIDLAIYYYKENDEQMFNYYVEECENMGGKDIAYRIIHRDELNSSIYQMEV